MKRIDAIWERKNLNLNVLEIVFENDEENITDNLQNEFEKYDYIVAKVPIKQISLVHKLENSKFFFVESQFDLIKKINSTNSIPKRLLKVSKSSRSEKVTNKNQLNMILDNIKRNIFDTDRISLDPYLGIELANKRYKNWITNIFNSGKSEIFNIIHNENTIGFYIINDYGSSVRILLGGLYNKYKMFGLGFSLISAPINLAVSRNKKHLKGRVSSNNFQVLKIYQEYGYFINDIKYVFRRLNIRK
jgi:nitrogen regulatory protein PII-like uncharacterized protein